MRRRVPPGGEPDGALGALARLARHRHTNRAPFRPDAVDPEVLASLARHRGDGDALPVAVRHLRSWPERSRFAGFVAGHGGRDFAHAGAWRETHSFIRWSAGAASARGDGFTLEHLFGPLPAHDRWARRLALAPAVMAALSRIGYPRFLAGQLAAVVRRSPVIVLMGLPGGGPRAARRAVGRGGARGLLAGRHRRRPRPAPDQHRDPARRPPPRSPAAVLPARPRVLRGAARAPRRRVPGVPRRPAAAACRAL
ncbi:hypothetical protein [Actinomadura madurae]|uniref:hypothetical protein n=1 Tax=Actinomadura madurae TaxID=1993 RepID=UPI0020D20D76|nr:hypothetical protein [Actinomadura madurae]MCP9949827.1 hypothetical protein [Actinomadura madurae]MCQ0009405.1 hypothetical protein [Actinomadura madurae]